MNIYNPKGYVILDVQVDDNSYRHRAVMGDHTLTLYFALADHVEIPVGSYCEFQGDTYTLERPENLKMNHSRHFEYTVVFDAPEVKAKIWKFRNPVDGRLKFSLTAKPVEHLQMFVDNMNRRDTGWTVGDCIDGAEKVICYDHAFCYDALAQMASEFKTEFEFIRKRVSLKKVEYNKANPLPLSYGRGNGFKSGVGRSNTGEQPPTEILFVQGGSQNIDPSKYGGCATLLLPKNQSLAYDGTYFEDEDGYEAANSRIYVVDELGMSIRRDGKTPSSYAEDSLDCSEIVPKYVGQVSEVVVVDEENHFYDIVDLNIPESMNFTDCQIGEEKIVIKFQTGMLAGREFEANYFHEANEAKGKRGRRFEIVPQEIDGQTMPNETFLPSGEYVVFNVMMPDAYIRDDETKTGASWEMFRAAIKHLYDNEDMKFTFTGELDGIWAKKTWLNLSGRILLGGYILFSDERFQPDGALVRITGIKEYINKPYSPVIELSNSTVTGGVSSALKELQAEEVLIEDYHRAALQFTKRRFRDAKETISMLEKSLLNYSDSINPIAVQTMSMLVGDESLQFRFVSNKEKPVQVAHAITYNNETKQLTAKEGIIQHMTLGISSLSSGHSVSEYKFWDVSEYSSAYLEDGSISYYLYIKASRKKNTAEFFMSETALRMDEVADVYYFLVGVLNTEYDGERSFVTLYGFTEVLPARVTTDRVVSSDGNSFFDMVANALKLGSAMSFNTQGDGKLRIRGTIVQSESGEENQIGCYRGVYNDEYVYYQGDETTYAVNNLISTYRYIYGQPSKGNPPTETLYWQVIAQGSQGQPGRDGADGKDGADGIDGKDGIDGISPNTSFKSTAFCRTNSRPILPEGGSYASPKPSTDGWSDEIPDGEQILWASTRVFSSDGKDPQESAWSTPRQMTDTADFDIEFSSVENPTAPNGHPNTNTQWSNKSGKNTIWMAISRKSNGVWDDWEVSRIKGEKGEDGTSIKVKGTLASSDNLPQTPSDASDCYIIGKDLYVWDGDSWVNVGQFKGADGADGANGKDGADGANGKDGTDGLNAYVHIKYAKSLTENDWSENNGETPNRYIGIYADNSPTDSRVWSDYTWSKWEGDDGFGYEYIYQRTQEYTAPNTPTSISQADNYIPNGWTDSPSGVSEEWPYEWVCYRKKTGGSWGAFKGSYEDISIASLWAAFSLPINPNLLKQSEFESEEKMDKWVNRNGSIVVGRDGHNAFFGSPEPEAEIYKELLKQVVYRSESDRVLENNQWYTLSFLAKGTRWITFNVGQTSNLYGFGTHSIYLLHGEQIEFIVKGACGAYATSEGRYLRTYIYKEDWSWSDCLDITNSSTTKAHKTLSIPSTGLYKITSYVYPNTSDGQPTSGVVRVERYGINRGNRFCSYVYPSAIDTSEGCYIDGVKQTSVAVDGCVTWQLTNEWVRHSFTFKTKDAITAVQQVLFRMTLNNNGLYICQPKLESGKVATAFCPNSGDMHNPYYEYRYAKNGSTSTPPSLTKTAASPSGWSTTQPTVSTGEYLWMTFAKKDTSGNLMENWSTPVRITPYDGQDGKDGKTPAMTFRGEYDKTKSYVGNEYRIDCVKKGSEYFVARVDAGTFTNVAPPDTSKWNPFGASFESIATGMLLTDLANIAGFIFRNNRLESQKLSDGTTTDGSTTKTPMMLLDGTNGLAQFAGGKIKFNADGTVDIGNGKFLVKNDGSVVMKDVMAENGTFEGVVRAKEGFGLKSTDLTGETDVMGSSDCFGIGRCNTVGGYNYNQSVYLPAYPLDGQVFYVRNMNGDKSGMKIIANGSQRGITYVSSEVRNYDYNEVVGTHMYNLLTTAHNVRLLYGHSAMFIYEEDNAIWHMITLD